MTLLTLLQTILFLSPLTLTTSLYPKSSAVLQIDARSYPRLIEKSNYTTILEFYAPWCGHCRNLQPAYEKAASSLSGLAKVAAVNCDDDPNKAFCGGMGVQGFPTLKIIKPKKKGGGKPIVEDYNGARTAKAIKEAVLERLPNHVTKITDKSAEEFMKKEGKPRGVFFSEKGVIPPLVKALAIEFLGSLEVGFVSRREKGACEMFMVDEFPKVAFVMSGEHVPNIYQGELKKEPLVEYFERMAGVKRNPEWSTDTGKKGTKKDKKSKTAAGGKKAPKGHPEMKEGASCPAGKQAGASKADATAETIQVDETNPTATESPNPNVASDSPKPINVPVEEAPEISKLDSEAALQRTCLNTKSGTCVLAIISDGADREKAGIASLNEIAHKHALRKAKLFPFYQTPESNEAGQTLLRSLGINDPSAHATIVAVNAKRSWWTRYTNDEMGREAIEAWVDNIRFGDFSKQKMPDGVVKEAEKVAEKEEEKQEKTVPLEGDWPEGLKVEMVEEPDEGHDEL